MEEIANYVPQMYATFWALIPPVVAIVLALITKEVYSSLFLGIVIGGLFWSNFRFEATVNHVFKDGIVRAQEALAAQIGQIAVNIRQRDGGDEVQINVPDIDLVQPLISQRRVADLLQVPEKIPHIQIVFVHSAL